MSIPTPDHNVTRDNQQPVSPGATPRTDREQYQVIPGADHKEDAVVSVDFARELERENNALRARVASDKYDLEQYHAMCTRIWTALGEQDRDKVHDLPCDVQLAAHLQAATERADALRRECDDYRKDINGLLEECAKHISLSNDFPWSEEIYCAFRHLEDEIARLTKTKHTDAFRFLEQEATKADLTAARDELAKWRTAIEDIQRSIPASDGNGGLYVMHFDGEGNELGPESVDPIALISHIEGICYRAPRGGSGGRGGEVNELALFAGAGGGILGGHLLGWRTVCAVELDPYAASVLLARQNDGLLAPFPVWDDVRTFNGKLWRGIVDVVSGGFPCTDISCAGLGAGIEGEKSGLWMEMARIVGEVRPSYVLVENSPMLVSRGMGRVLGDLAALGYDARWGVIGADACGFPHHRARMWVVANSQRRKCGPKQHDGPSGRMGWIKQSPAWKTDWQGVITQFRGDRYGLANRLDRTDAVRNGQVPAVVRLAWETLKP